MGIDARPIDIYRTLRAQDCRFESVSTDRTPGLRIAPDGNLQLLMHMPERLHFLIRLIQCEKRLIRLKREIELHDRRQRQYRKFIAQYYETAVETKDEVDYFMEYFEQVLRNWHESKDPVHENARHAAYYRLINAYEKGLPTKALICDVLAHTTHSTSNSKDVRHMEGLFSLIVADVSEWDPLEHTWVQAAMSERLSNAEICLIDLTQTLFIAREFLEHTCREEISQEVAQGLPRQILDQNEVWAQWETPRDFTKLVLDFTAQAQPALVLLSEEVVTNITRNTDEECTICHGKFEATDRVLSSEVCYHRWHEECIRTCLQTPDANGLKPTTCPIDRRSLYDN